MIVVLSEGGSESRKLDLERVESPQTKLHHSDVGGIRQFTRYHGQITCLGLGNSELLAG